MNGKLRQYWESLESPAGYSRQISHPHPYGPTAFEWPFRYPCPLHGRCLDFGCGLGRQIQPLLKVFHVVDGYDLPNAIRFIPDTSKALYGHVTSDWQDVSGRKYDAIYAYLVFQHIDADELDEKLATLARMAPVMLARSRVWLDDKEADSPSVLRQIEKHWILRDLFSDTTQSDLRNGVSFRRYGHFTALFIS